MDPREEKILDAAMRVFTRYGVRKTTMADIAGEAGVARQTLYNVYANKEDVLRGTIRHSMAQSLADIEAAFAGTPDLAGRLDIILDHLVVRPFDMITASPEADDLINGVNAACVDELAVVGQRFREVLERVLAPRATAVAKSGMTVPELADLIFTAGKGAKTQARDRAHLLALVASLKTMALMAAGEPVRLAEPV